MQRDFQRPKNYLAKPANPVVPPLQPAAPKKRRSLARFSKKRLATIAVVVALLVIGLLGYGYFSTKNELSKLNDPQAAAQAEAEDLAREIGRYLELPTDETPTLATVSDVSKLQEQLFFQKAQNGDRVLVYAQAQRAVLYRPSTKKVLEYAPVNLGGTEQ